MLPICVVLKALTKKIGRFGLFRFVLQPELEGRSQIIGISLHGCPLGFPARRVPRACVLEQLSPGMNVGRFRVGESVKMMKCP